MLAAGRRPLRGMEGRRAALLRPLVSRADSGAAVRSPTRAAGERRPRAARPHRARPFPRPARRL